MQNVYLSIDTFSKKVHVLYSPAADNLETATFFSLDIDEDSLFGGYCDYSTVLNDSFSEMLQLNDITEANLSIAVPSADVTFDYLTLPNLNNQRKNEDILITEFKKMYPFIKKISDIKYYTIKTTKTNIIYMYPLFNSENLSLFNSFLVNTNHNLSFLTSNAIASASFAISVIGSSILRKDVYQFINMRKNYTDCALIVGDNIYSTFTVPYGTKLLENYNEKDLVNYKLFAEIEKTISPLMQPIMAYINRCNSLGVAESKKAVVHIADGYNSFLDILNRDSDITYEKFLVPSQYSMLDNNLELLGMFLSKVNKDLEFSDTKIKQA